MKGKSKGDSDFIKERPSADIKCFPTPRNAQNRVNVGRRQAKRMVFCTKCDKVMLERHKCI